MTTIQRIWRLRNRLIRLSGTKCQDCGLVTYPPKAACPKCGSRNLIEIELPHEGEVLTYTVLNVPIKGFEQYAPLIIAIIKLGEAKVLAQLTDVKPEEVRVGMRVRATIRRTAPTLDGVVPYVVKFKPVRGEEASLKEREAEALTA